MPDYQEYIQDWRERLAAETAVGIERKQKALKDAEKMTSVLFEKYGVSEVYIFGSVVFPDKPFTEHSDIDIAVSGLFGADFFKAWRDLESVRDFRVDLHELENCSEGFLQMIQSYGRHYTRNGSTLLKAQ